MKRTEQTIKLSNFIKNRRINSEMSVNERSFQIFGDEKFLASDEGKTLLRKSGLSYGFLKVYQTPEPFIFYCAENASKNVLIVENKDTWYTMRRVLKEGGNILGLDVSVLIYGEGRKIQSSLAYAKEAEVREKFEEKTFLYFGDIDSSGLDILVKLKSKYPEFFIKPFEDGYRFLYEKRAFKREKSVKSISFPRERMIGLFPFFSVSENEEIYRLCNENFIIPQEALNYEILKNGGENGQTNTSL